MTSETRVLAPCRLSVIVANRGLPWPLPQQRALAERTVMSVLDQLQPGQDPIGTEVIFADDGTSEGTADHIESVFAEARLQGKLTALRLERSGDLGRTRNRAVQSARGSLLAFVDSGDLWKPGRLLILEPMLRKHDLILATDTPVGESSDWVRAFLSANWAVPGSGVIRRSLFEEVGGFTEGYTGYPLPRRLPGQDDYDLWLRSLTKLSSTARAERFLLIPNEHVVPEDRDQHLEMLGPRMKERVQAGRELFTLLNVGPRLPAKYWRSVASRIAGVGKSLFKK